MHARLANEAQQRLIGVLLDQCAHAFGLDAAHASGVDQMAGPHAFIVILAGGSGFLGRALARALWAWAPHMPLALCLSTLRRGQGASYIGPLL